MNSLPPELKGRICHYLHPRDACAVRLVCKSLYPQATEQAFSVLIIRNENYNFRANHVLSTVLKEHVRHVVYRSVRTTLYANLEDDGMTKRPTTEVFATEIKEREATMPEQFCRAWLEPENFGSDGCAEYKRGHFVSVSILLRKLSNIPRLRKFSVIFHEAQLYEHLSKEYSESLGQQCPMKRLFILMEIFRALEGAQELKSLEIYNLENRNNEYLTDLPAFHAVLSRLESLRICLMDIWIGGYTDEMVFSDFIDTWLESYAGKLKTLSLWVKDRFSRGGRGLPFNLTRLHFPRLEELEMGNWTVTGHNNLNWLRNLRKMHFYNWRLQVDRRQDSSWDESFHWAAVYSMLKTLPMLTEFGNARHKSDIDYSGSNIKECKTLYQRASPELEEYFESIMFTEVVEEGSLLLQYEVFNPDQDCGPTFTPFENDFGPSEDWIPNTENDVLEFKSFQEAVGHRLRYGNAVAQ